MKVVIILSDMFADTRKSSYDDLGFFNEFRRRIGAMDGLFPTLQSVQGTGITLKEAKTEVQKAEDYLNGHSLDEAADLSPTGGGRFSQTLARVVKQREIAAG